MDSRHQVIMADCMGVCGGVSHALKLFDEASAARKPGEHIYVLHELVHNSCVTQRMIERGAIFIDDPAVLPRGATVLIGAHGATLAEREALSIRAGKLLDTTCPIVANLHSAVSRLGPEDELVIYGQRDHQEIKGIVSCSHAGVCLVIGNADAVASLPVLKHPALLCQTTLNHHDCQDVAERLSARFPQWRRIGETCHASQERQQAVEALVKRCDALIVVGSKHSANARHLLEIGLRHGLPAWLVNTPDDLPDELRYHHCIGITAAASTTSDLIKNVTDAIEASPWQPS